MNKEVFIKLCPALSLKGAGSECDAGTLQPSGAHEKRSSEMKSTPREGHRGEQPELWMLWSLSLRVYEDIKSQTSCTC